MKATLLFLAAGVMVVVADDKDDKKNAAQPNTRFLGGFGGPDFGGSSFGNQGFGGQGFGNQGFGGPGFGGLGFGGQGFNSFGQGFNSFGSSLGGLFGGFPSPVAPPSTCRHWCRTPQNQAYCCEDAREVPSPVGVKPGRCPPVRPVCPPTRSFQPPATCSNDGRCGGFDKCCFDTCLQEHVCKPPFGFGF